MSLLIHITGRLRKIAGITAIFTRERIPRLTGAGTFRVLVRNGQTVIRLINKN